MGPALKRGEFGEPIAHPDQTDSPEHHDFHRVYFHHVPRL